MIKGAGISGLIALVLVFFVSGACAYTMSLTDVNATLATVSITDADELYAYETVIDYSGSNERVSYFGFIGSGASVTNGYTESGGNLTVYESKLNSTRTGTTGGGSLFNVTHSGTLHLKSGIAVKNDGTYSITSYTWCGDGACNGAETCSSCSGDCGSCSTATSGGGGGGGAGVQTVASDGMIVVPSEIEINTIANRETVKEITILNRADYPINLKIVVEGFGKDAVLDKDLVTLDGGKEVTVKLTVLKKDSGLSTGKILVMNYGQIIKEIPAILNVMSENFLLDAKITIPYSSRIVQQGKNVLAQVDLTQVGPREKIDVVATYVIKDFSGNTLYEESETFYVLGEKSFPKTFPTTGLADGKYVLGMEITYPGAFATSSAQFQVGQPISVDARIIILMLALVLVVVVVVIIIVSRRTMRTREILKTRKKQLTLDGKQQLSKI